MSYDYFFFARPADGSEPRLETLGRQLAPIGAAADVIAGIDAVFPSLRWQPPQGTITSWLGGGVPGQPEFFVAAEADDLVMSFKAGHIERADVDALASRMRLAVFDPQSGECYAP